MVVGIVGPMFSGKSSELLRLLERKHIAGKKCLLIRPEKDTRKFVARGWDNEAIKGMADVLVIDDFGDIKIPRLLNDYDAIFVDEFWMIKNNVLLCQMSYSHHIDLYFCGIWANVNQELWPEAAKLIPYFDEITKLNAVCTECGSEHANYSVRLDGNMRVATDIGAGVGDAEYTVLCRRCFLKRKQKEATEHILNMHVRTIDE